MKSLIKFAVKSLSWFLNLWPRRWVMGVGSILGFLWIDFLRVRRRVILQNLQIAFPEWPLEKKILVGRQSVYNMGQGFMELLRVPALDSKWLSEQVVFEGEEYYQQALAKKKGVLALSLHIGNGDVGSTAVVMRGYPLTIITKIFKNPLANEFWFSFRGAQGVKYIDAHGPSTSFDILKTLKRNEGVTFVLDQFMGKPFGVATTFFGKRTGTAYGLALFAIKTQAPVLPIYTYEGKDRRLHVVFEPEIPIQDLIGEDKEESMVAITQRFNDKIEEIIRKHPEQWMWVHRRWKSFE